MTPAALAGRTEHASAATPFSSPLPTAATTVMPSAIILRTAASNVVIAPPGLVTPKLMFATAGPET